MNKYIYYVFTAISFALLIAAPGRFAFGLLICFELFFLFGFGILFSFLAQKANLHDLNSAVTIISLVFATVLYKQLIMLIFPVIALQLSFVFYLPTVTSYMIGIIYDNIEKKQSFRIFENIKIIGIFSCFALIFYLIRDIFGYGTFTLPSFSGLIEKVIFDVDSFSLGIFFASIPGALFLVSASILIFIFVQHKINIVERSSNDFEKN